MENFKYSTLNPVITALAEMQQGSVHKGWFSSSNSHLEVATSP